MILLFVWRQMTGAIRHVVTPRPDVAHKLVHGKFSTTGARKNHNTTIQNKIERYFCRLKKYTTEYLKVENRPQTVENMENHAMRLNE